MFSRSLEYSLNEAFTHAREQRHEFITVEHLLLCLVDNPEASHALVACGVSTERLQAGLKIYVNETTPRIPPNVDRDIQPTLSFQRVLQRAIYQVQSMGTPEVNGMNVLSAIFGEQDSQAVYFLNQENVTRIDIVNYITQNIVRSQDDAQFDQQSQFPQQESFSTTQRDTEGEENLIEMYTVNLNAKALSGQLNPVIGRENEIERCIQVLCRRSKNNPMFVGEAGVGKTAIAEGLAQRIVSNQVPDVLSFTTIYSVDLGLLLAGTKYRGDFEKRFKSVLTALSSKTGAIVFIDEIHNLIGAGSATGGTMDASNLIKPMLSSGELRCMGATTYEEFRNFIAKDHALLRRFQKIDVEEPSFDETLEILEGLKSRFEKFHNITYTNDAMYRAVELASRYLPDRRLPDKAIDLIDEAGAFQRLQSIEQRSPSISSHEIEEVIAKMVRVPLASITSTDKEVLESLDGNLKKKVFGQDHAIHQLVTAITLSRSGIQNMEKPIGSFLLAGPTGVGKTEVTKQLADCLGIDLIRFDMSEYMESHTVSRLIGSPPGYVGYEQGGLLTEEIIKKPHCVLLLDEIEKAHVDLFNILLQIMDYGTLTDNNGRKADFRHVIIVMTTNAGAKDMERLPIGFSDDVETPNNTAAIKSMFSPEFRNRLDAVVTFGHLPQSVIGDVVEKHLSELKDRLAEKSIDFRITDSAKKWLAKKGYDKLLGARPMERLITEQIKVPLAQRLLFGDLQEGGKEIIVSLSQDAIKISVTNHVAAVEEQAQ
ncbi:MAG: ATP-dependent Clp protease ATP-binding subunit ClpA [Coxiellaceae bacterium]|nr:ATP-dependent Clp protease ATP-binding subunit ClpA [Coxiellaceae bacterium]|tara:strand:- start:1261 stop:3555 length:2295 start_codon:yes stop_codon:yes gene_type:complete